jgi:hypothetical protein
MYEAGTFSYNMKKVAHAINEFQKSNNLETFATDILNIKPEEKKVSATVTERASQV